MGGRLGLPASTAPRRNRLVGVHLIDLLQRQALCLVDHEVHKGDAQEAAGEPHKEDLALQVGIARAVVDQVRRRVRNRPVEQPLFVSCQYYPWRKNVGGSTYVGSGGHGQARSAVLEREDLARDDPRQGAPGGRKEEDVDADKGDGRLLRSNVVHDDVAGAVLARAGRAEHGDDELADAHADGAEEEQRAAAPCVGCVEPGDGGYDVDGRGDEGDGEGVGDARVEEVLRAVVEDEVDS